MITVCLIAEGMCKGAYPFLFGPPFLFIVRILLLPLRAQITCRLPFPTVSTRRMSFLNSRQVQPQRLGIHSKPVTAGGLGSHRMSSLLRFFAADTSTKILNYTMVVLLFSKHSPEKKILSCCLWHRASFKRMAVAQHIPRLKPK